MSGSIMIMGEVLGDVFPEQTVIGGAPYNVARHCHAFGLDVHFISAVGRDALGARILDEMRACGLPVGGVQVCEQWPTGQVAVHMGADGHRFEILDQQAYDALLWSPIEAYMQSCSLPRLVYFGSLALRHAPMQALLPKWLAQCGGATVLCDINLRAPWYDADSLRLALQSADILKINHEELPEVCRLLGFEVSSDLHALATRLLMYFGLSEMFVTCGEEGGFWLNRFGDGLRVPPTPLRDRFVDSVGAGDAYTSVIVRGLLAGWSRQTLLPPAAGFPATVCGIRGAVPADADFYADFL